MKQFFQKNNLLRNCFFAVVFLCLNFCAICFCLNLSIANVSSISSAESLAAINFNSMTSLKLDSLLNLKSAPTPSPEKNVSQCKHIKKKLNPPENSNSSNCDYCSLYPNLYTERPFSQFVPAKTAFLTFDDGPSERTVEILDILSQRNIKATFFVTGKSDDFSRSLMQRIVKEGHTIAVHTYTHNFRAIYSSVQTFLDDFNRIYTLIHETTGVKPDIFRFPGGSKNGFNKHNYREIVTEMTRRGFDYFDWNVSSGDAVSKTPTPAHTCVSNVLNHSANLDACVILMHDLRTKLTTVEALPAIIDGLIDQGFCFDKLSNDINPSPFSLLNPYK